jgi:hypothetical protein
MYKFANTYTSSPFEADPPFCVVGQIGSHIQIDTTSHWRGVLVSFILSMTTATKINTRAARAFPSQDAD